MFAILRRQQGSGLLCIQLHLLGQCIQIFKMFFFSQLFDKLDFQMLSIKVAIKVKYVHFQ